MTKELTKDGLTKPQKKLLWHMLEVGHAKSLPFTSAVNLHRGTEWERLRLTTEERQSLYELVEQEGDLLRFTDKGAALAMTITESDFS